MHFSLLAFVFAGITDASCDSFCACQWHHTLPYSILGHNEISNQDALTNLLTT